MGLSCLIDRPEPIFIDTSAAINLNASGAAKLILKALPNRVLITDVVLDELREDVRTGRRDRALTEDLILQELIFVEKLTDTQEIEFEKLVVGPGSTTLDDGEAATIAACSTGERIAILDERKGRRLARERYSHVPFGSTCDLFSHPSVLRDIGQEALVQALLSALHQARMPVVNNHRDWVLRLVGRDAAGNIPSLRRMVKGCS